MSENLSDITTIQQVYELVHKMGPRCMNGVDLISKHDSAEGFNGHVCLLAPSPRGGVFVLLGQFSTKDICAVGLLPLAEVFYALVEKGFSLSELIKALNNKLISVLPETCFFSTSLIWLNPKSKQLSIWNGGSSEFFVTDSNRVIKSRIPGLKIALGNSETIEAEPIIIDVTDTDTGYLSMIDSIDKSNELQTLFEKQLCVQGDISLEYLKPLLPVDFTVLRLSISELSKVQPLGGALASDLPTAPVKIDFDFHAVTLKKVDVIPIMLNAVLQTQAPYEHRQRMHTILAELFNNALEHGVLQLNSALKQTAEGFCEYYKNRMAKLAELEQGFIRVSLSHEPLPLGQGGVFKVFVEDSGQGFDHQLISQNTDDQQLSGRGLIILKQLCNKLEYKGIGNVVCADYIWS
jgi:anti-sigma regulatory factor (Ser/Thr protein kinase)